MVTLCNIRTKDHINRVLKHAIANNSDELGIHCHTDLLFLNHFFARGNLDEVDTTPFPTPPPSPVADGIPAVAPTIGTSHLPIVPSASIFNCNPLPSDNFQDPTLIVPVLDSIGTTTNFHANPFIIGTHVILQNGSVLEGKPDEKQLSHDPPVCTDVTHLNYVAGIAILPITLFLVNILLFHATCFQKPMEDPKVLSLALTFPNPNSLNTPHGKMTLGTFSSAPICFHPNPRLQSMLLPLPMATQFFSPSLVIPIPLLWISQSFWLCIFPRSNPPKISLSSTMSFRTCSGFEPSSSWEGWITYSPIR
jgi:hypothetical protein